MFAILERNVIWYETGIKLNMSNSIRDGYGFPPAYAGFHADGVLRGAECRIWIKINPKQAEKLRAPFAPPGYASDLLFIIKEFSNEG